MLQGIRVLDLSRVIAGPYCAALLGDLGADVIKLERPGRGDDLRALRGNGRMSASFAAVNRNKRGIAVDLQKPEGARLAFDLARRADVVIENFLPGVAEKLGLGYAAVRAVNPAVVYASVTGFGQTGPLARKPGYNTIAQGMSGLMALTGMPGDPPTRVGGSVSDVAASYVTFGMVNAALVHRFRTGEGQHVDVSLVGASLGLLPDPVAIYFDTGERPKRAGNRIDFGRIHFAMEKVAKAGGIMVVHGEDEDLVQFNYERFREEGRLEGSNLHLVHTKLSELLAFRRTIALAKASGAGVYFVHVSAREGVESVAEARAQGLPVYGETLHQYACFTAEYYKTPRGFCSHTYPSLKFPEDQQALWDGLVRDGLSTLATDEYPTSLELKLKGRTIEDVTGGNVGAEARIGIGYTEGVVKRGMSLPRFADVTATNAARILGLYPKKGVIAPGSDADLVLIDPTIRKTLTRDDFHVTDYSPWEGWAVSGWPVLTLLRGKIIAERGRLLGSPSDGQWVSRRIDPAVLRRPVC